MALTSRAFADLITFTRASSGTYFDSNGVMQTATTDVPRFNYEYNGSTWVAKGLPIEPAATNLVAYSSEINGWSKSAGVTITADQAVSPDGTTTADLVSGATGAMSWGGAGIASSAVFSLSSSTSYTGSLYLKSAGAATTVTLGIRDSGTGTISTQVVTLTSSWQRVQVSKTTGGATTAFTFMLASADGDFYAVGVQMETGSIATSLIHTSGSAATRAADVALISGSNFSSWFNQSAGSVVTYANSPGVGTRVIWQIDDGTANNRYTLYTTGTSLKFDVVTGGVTQASLTLGTITANTTFKAAVAFATNDIAGVLNGGTVQTDASATLPTVGRKRLGADATGNQLTGHIERDVAYPTRLSNAQLQSLTA